MKKWFYITSDGYQLSSRPLFKSKGRQNPKRGDFVILGKNCYRYLEINHDSGGDFIGQETLAYLARPHFPATLEGASFDFFVIDDKRIAIVIVDADFVKQISELGGKARVYILPQFFYQNRVDRPIFLSFEDTSLETCRRLEEHEESHLVVESEPEGNDFESIDFTASGKLRLKKLFRKNSRSGKIRWRYVLLAALVLNVCFWIFSFSRIVNKEKYVEELSIELENKNISDANTGKESASALLQYQYLLSLKPESLIRFFYSLESVVDSNLEINSFSFSKGAFSLSGYAEDTLVLVKEMNEVPLFSEIATTRISRDSDSGREEFTIKGKYHE